MNMAGQKEIGAQTTVARSTNDGVATRDLIPKDLLPHQPIRTASSGVMPMVDLPSTITNAGPLDGWCPHSWCPAQQQGGPSCE